MIQRFISRALALIVALTLCVPAQASVSMGAVAASRHRLFYDQRFGTATDTSGWVTFGLKPGAKRVYANPATGNDSNDCLSAGAACATYNHAFVVFQTGLTAGDQLMLAEGQTYTDSISGTCCYGAANFSTTGVSAQYPYAVQSYDPADPTNATKYGRAVGSAMPVVQLTVETPSLSMNVGSGNGYLAISGVELKGRSSQISYLSDGLSYTGRAGPHPVLIFQNMRFNHAGLSFSGGNQILISKGSFFDSTGIYADPISDGSTDCHDIRMQDLVMVHNGWTTGASRYDTQANGGATGFQHTFYIHAGCSNVAMARVLSFDSANEGVGPRTGAKANQWVSVDNPNAFIGAGFSIALAEQPGGALFQLDDAAAIGSDIISGSLPPASVFSVDNLLPNSYARNVAVLDDPNSNNNLFNYVRKYDAGGEISSSFLLDKLSTWNAGIDSSNVSGSIGYVDKQFPTHQTLNITNSILQNTITPTLAWSVPGTASYTWTTTLINSAAVNVTTRSSAPTGYKTKNQVIAALGFASKAAWVNAAMYRPDLPWARSAIGVVLPAMGLRTYYPTAPPPTVTSPPSYYPLTLVDLTASTLTFARGTVSTALLTGTSANMGLTSSDLPSGFTITGRLLSYDGTGSGAATPTVHVLETSVDTLATPTHTTALALNITGGAWTPTTPAQTLIAYYDISDTSTVLKSGLVPVTADGDVVVKVLDKSGNAHDLVPFSGSSSIVYHTSGGKHWLAFDGSGGLQSSAAFSLVDGSGQHSTIVGGYFANNTGTQNLIDVDNFGGAGRLAQTLRNASGTAQSISFDNGGSATTDSGPSITAAVTVVLAERTSTSGVEAYVNGTGDGSTALTGTRANFATVLCIGTFNCVSQQVTGRYYGSLHYAGVISTGDVTSGTTWMQAKQ